MEEIDNQIKKFDEEKSRIEWDEERNQAPPSKIQRKEKILEKIECLNKEKELLEK